MALVYLQDILVVLRTPEYLAGIAGALQALGYLTYIGYVLARKLEPNPTSWFMWAYGTAFVTALEWNLGASWTLLALPVVCSVSSMVLALVCLSRGTLQWPNNPWDALAFVVDMALTVGYIGTWVLLKEHLLTAEQQQLAALAFLVLTNATVLTSFGPMLREVMEHPELERTAPWIIWTCAYASLTWLTVTTVGLSQFLIYPATNLLIHSAIALMVFFGRLRGARATS